MRKFLLLPLLTMILSAKAQAPDDYYNSADGKSGQTLRTALESIISGHVQRSYANLWTDFRSTDARTDGKVWDMYSSATNYSFGTDQIGSAGYSSEGDGYNREHSFPNSWFNKEYPMYTDLYHMYPTDGYVNNQRNNYPFGEVGTATYTSSGKFSKLGTASTSGYSGTVFEPADEYKGDFARTYFYMVTCYASKVSTWSSDMLTNGDLSSWAIDLLLRWSRNDPVSTKEKNRIEAVYSIQKNRNPFIDCPGLEEYIWGNKKNSPVDLSTLTGIVATPSNASLKCRICKGEGALLIEAFSNNTPIIIYDISGRMLIHAIIEKGEHKYPLQKGVYIAGGKKFVIE